MKSNIEIIKYNSNNYVSIRTYLYEYNLYSLKIQRYLVNTRKKIKIFIIKQIFFMLLISYIIMLFDIEIYFK